MKTQKIFYNGKYLALVFGPFGQFSLHASDFVELVAQSRALLMMRHRKIIAGHAYGLCRAPVVSRIGLAGSLERVRLILDRFRGTVCPHSSRTEYRAKAAASGRGKVGGADIRSAGGRAGGRQHAGNRGAGGGQRNGAGQ